MTITTFYSNTNRNISTTCSNIKDIIPPHLNPLPYGERIEVRRNNILDIGTGCGNIAVSIAVECRDCHIFAVDKSDASLSVAKKNAVTHGAAERITFFKGDLYSGLQYKDYFDIIVSNPPYIPTEDIEKLMSEVKDWEPRLALDGGKDGLEVIRRIIDGAQGGCIVMEIGFGQAEDVRNIIKETGKFSDIKVIKDLSGIERVVVAWKK